MTSTAEQMRAGTGTANLTFGFRPFFFGAAVWAAPALSALLVALTIWVALPLATPTGLALALAGGLHVVRLICWADHRALAGMTLATLGHTRQALASGSGRVIILAALILSVMARVTVGVWPAMSGPLLSVAGLFWIAAFCGIAVIHGTLLLRQPSAKRV